MKVMSTVLTSALLLSGCSQISEHFYSKKTFNSQSFEVDIGQVRELLDFLALTSSFEGFATRPTAASYS
jgi:PBP1b-binding outer membrane lipoprotein LpoB